MCNATIMENGKRTAKVKVWIDGERGSEKEYLVDPGPGILKNQRETNRYIAKFKDMLSAYRASNGGNLPPGNGEQVEIDGVPCTLTLWR